MQWSCFVLRLRGIQRAFEFNVERKEAQLKLLEDDRLEVWEAEALRLPPLWVELIKNWNMYLILVVECSFIHFRGEVLAINSFSCSQEPFTITCRNLFRFWFFFFLHFRSFVFRFYQHFLKGNNNNNHNNFYIISSLILMHTILKLELRERGFLLVTVPGENRNKPR